MDQSRTNGRKKELSCCFNYRLCKLQKSLLVEAQNCHELQFSLGIEVKINSGNFKSCFFWLGDLEVLFALNSALS